MRGFAQVAFLAAALLVPVARPAGATSWQQVFTADTDTVLFLGSRGELLKAPFHLTQAETLWLPRGEERLVRLRVSPDGRKVAWISRASQLDTTRLWIAGERGVRDPVRFFSLDPSRFDRIHYEPGMPTLEDPARRGARFLSPTLRMRRVSANPLEWTPDSRAAVFGFNDGIAAAPVDSGLAFEVSKALAVRIRALEPAPIYLVDAVVLRGRDQLDSNPPSGRAGGLDPGSDTPGGAIRSAARPARGTYLLYPLPHRWRVFAAEGLAMEQPWAASPATVWWANGRRILAIRTSDPRVTEEVKSPQSITWLGYLTRSRELVWASGPELRSRPEDGGEAAVLYRAAGPILAVLQTPTERLGVVSDRLTLWEPGTRKVREVALAGRTPTALFEGPGGVLIAVTVGPRDRVPQLARVDLEFGRLVPIETPAIRGGVVVAAPGGARLVLFDPGAEAPATLRVYDIAGANWTDVANPGLIGWEPMSPR